MTTQLAFAFGMLVMVAITMIVAIVIGMVKVIKHDKQFKSIQHEFEHLHRHLTDNERNLYSEVNETRRKFDEYTDNLRRELQAYTDSRIDKTLVTTGSKQLLKN